MAAGYQVSSVASFTWIRPTWPCSANRSCLTRGRLPDGAIPDPCCESCRKSLCLHANQGGLRRLTVPQDSESTEEGKIGAVRNRRAPRSARLSG